jgi:hypothetical protein
VKVGYVERNWEVRVVVDDEKGVVDEAKKHDV